MNKVLLLGMCFGSSLFGLSIVLHKVELSVWMGWAWMGLALLNAIFIIIDDRISWWSSKHTDKDIFSK